jgi:hypothetical protein
VTPMLGADPTGPYEGRWPSVICGTCRRVLETDERRVEPEIVECNACVNGGVLY